MKRITIAGLAAALAGCSQSITEPSYEPDQCLRAQLFQQCLATVPKGPEATRYNDWDEVVEACERSAYNQSIRAAGTVPGRCSVYKSEATEPKP
jgi:hypothetical protein